MQTATCCIAVSGSVSLELLHYARPTVIVYQVSRGGYLVQGFFRRVKYITLVNLLSASDSFAYHPAQATAAEVPFPEYLTCVDKSREVSEHIVEWLTNDRAYDERVAQLTALRQRVGAPGASEHAARYVLEKLARRTAPPVLRPHFVLGTRVPSSGGYGLR
jgi:lipid-A-disaccharide synthase